MRDVAKASLVYIWNSCARWHSTDSTAVQKFDLSWRCYAQIYHGKGNSRKARGRKRCQNPFWAVRGRGDSRAERCESH